jgi:hypothetical protein
MEKIRLVAKEGTKCPMEGKPREYITDAVPVEVPESTYYRRLIRDGSLKFVSGQAGKRSSEKTLEPSNPGTLESSKSKGGKKS